MRKIRAVVWAGRATVCIEEFCYWKPRREAELANPAKEENVCEVCGRPPRRKQAGWSGPRNREEKKTKGEEFGTPRLRITGGPGVDKGPSRSQTN